MFNKSFVLAEIDSLAHEEQLSRGKSRFKRIIKKSFVDKVVITVILRSILIMVALDCFSFIVYRYLQIIYWVHCDSIEVCFIIVLNIFKEVPHGSAHVHYHFFIFLILNVVWLEGDAVGNGVLFVFTAFSKEF